MVDERLKKVSGYVTGDTLVDIGSDHAYLPIYAYKNNMIKNAICGEVVEGPFKSTLKNIQQHGLSSIIEARLGDGLTILNGETVQTITICGMGGPLIAKILEDGFENVGNKPRLVLQANTYTYPVRKTVSKLGYAITHEEVLKDGRHFYEIIVCDYSGTHQNYNEFELQFGPINLAKKTETFISKLNWELEHQKRILSGIEDSEKNKAKIDDIKKKIQEREEVLKDEDK